MRLGPRTRLALLVAVLVAAWAAFLVLQPFDKGDLQAWIDPFGAAAPLVYVAASVALALLVVPGALLAATAGLLFGALLGGALSLVSATITAVLGLLIARRVGREGVERLGSARIEAFAAAMERHGIWAVIAQRLAPGVPDGPCNYAAGLVRVRPRDIALGTLVGSLPRGFSYAALGDSIDDPTSPQALAALALLGLTALAGLWAVRRGIVRARTSAE
jgi:uncharacterized membrane protein YdjX (TVP38/TMEM64 family)